MAPATSSASMISLTPGVPFVTKKSTLSRCSFPRKPSKQPLLSQKYILPFSTSVRLFPHFRIGCISKPKQRSILTSATGTDVALGEVDLSSADNEASPSVTDSTQTNGEPSASAISDAGSAKAKRTRPARKSEMPPVKDEDLVPGATFAGKVRSIQPFGAFVDFGAFTDGLVHVSQLSDSFVKDVASVVTVGQEVKVRLVEVNMENRRISLTMRENDAPNKVQQQRDAPGGDTSRPPRKANQKFNQKKDETKSKFVIGQELEGTVKNTTKSGAFISLPEDEEGFLPQSEEAGFVGMVDGSSLEVGQEVKVRVLRFSRGKATLTMKKEGAGGEDVDVIQGVVHSATNPFVLAFRSNKVISEFLDEKEDELVEKAKEEGSIAAVDNTISEVLDKEEDQSTTTLNVGGPVEVESVTEVESSPVIISDNGPVTEEQLIEEPSVAEVIEKEEEAVISGQVVDISSDVVDEVTEETVDAKVEAKEQIPILDIPESTEDPLTVDATDKLEEQEISSELTDQTLSNISEDVAEKKDDDIIAEVQNISVPDTSDPSATLGAEEAATPAPEESSSAENSTAQLNPPEVEMVPTEDSENVESSKPVNEMETPTSATPTEMTNKAVISPAVVKQLRDETGAGMMDCKNALTETGGDIVKAQEYLRKKGLASADKKAGRATAEGLIASYIHDSRIGILLEVNCETDFVARGDIFKELVDDLAMQVAACPQVQYVSADDVPKDIIDKERAIEMQKEDLLSKPEQFRSKIVDGRIRKRLEELALLEQPFIKDDKIVVKDWVKQTISTIGENMKVKRFVRYNLGEGLEKKSQDFAAEVAAQTAAKPTATTVVQEPVAAETKESVETPPKVAVSAALVKQLREETGAGMMDCKKALAETGGNLEAAQDYLRKKGLSSADKKSSRLAAEGRIGSYIHDSRIGVLIEVNCETDFVGRSELFKQLVDDLAMQVVACPQVQYVSVEDIPESIVNKEKQLEMQREDLQSKPENIREKIVEGRIGKRLGELALLDQSFIKDDSVLVKDLVKQTIATLGENIKVRRFVRFTLGEETETELVTEAEAAAE